ncbi:MAG: ATP-binding protein [Sporichthyaceae bacterium]
MTSTGPRWARLAVEPDLDSLAIARQFVGSCLRIWKLDEAVDNASLGVTELVANAVRHAPDTEAVGVNLSVTDRITITVLDDEPSLPMPATPADPLSPGGGRGLRIVAAVSRDWGTHPAEGGKAVWFSLDLPAA